MRDATLCIRSLGRSWSVIVPVDNERLTWEWAKKQVLWQSPSIQYPPGKTVEDVDPSYLDRAIFDGTALCPHAPLPSIGFSTDKDNVVYVIMALGAGMVPPSTLLHKVSLSYGSTSVSPTMKYLKKCPSTRHQQRDRNNEDEKCQWCGGLRFNKLQLEKVILPCNQNVIITLSFTRTSFPGQKDIYSVNLADVEEDIFVVCNTNNKKPLPGYFREVKKWNEANIPQLSWTSSDPLRAGTYEVVIHEHNFPTIGNASPVLGTTRFSFTMD